MNHEWIKIYESYEYHDSKLNTQIWLNDILKDNNIPYKNEVVSFWEGNSKSPKYLEKLFIYIPLEFKEKAEKYLEEYSNPNSAITDNIQELNCTDDTESEAKRIDNRQTKMKFWLGIVIIGMILTAVLCAFL